jgi:hypothetical protein
MIPFLLLSFLFYAYFEVILGSMRCDVQVLRAPGARVFDILVYLLKPNENLAFL